MERDLTALIDAVQDDDSEAVEDFYLFYQEAIDHNILHLAAECNSIKVIRTLFIELYYEFNEVNGPDSKGNTPLHYAAYNYNLKVVSMLLNYGVNSSIANNQGCTPLKYIAMKPGNSELKCKIMAKLIEYDFSELMYNLRDINCNNKTYAFINKIYEFANANSEILCSKNDHVPFIIKIANSDNLELIEQFINEFPEFLDIRKEYEKELFYIARNKDMFNLLDPIYNFSNKRYSWEQSPTLVINGTSEDLDKFEEAISDNTVDQFMTDFIKRSQIKYEQYCVENPTSPEFNVFTHNDVYALLLTASIQFRRDSIIDFVLSKDRSNIIIQTSASSYSPLSATLLRGNESILDKIKKYIRHYSYSPGFKGEYTEDDRANILTSLRHPEFEKYILSYEYRDLLEPLYINISPFTKLLDEIYEYESHYY